MPKMCYATFMLILVKSTKQLVHDVEQVADGLLVGGINIGGTGGRCGCVFPLSSFFVVASHSSAKRPRITGILIHSTRAGTLRYQ